MIPKTAVTLSAAGRSYCQFMLVAPRPGQAFPSFKKLICAGLTTDRTEDSPGSKHLCLVYRCVLIWINTVSYTSNMRSIVMTISIINESVTPVTQRLHVTGCCSNFPLLVVRRGRQNTAE